MGDNIIMDSTSKQCALNTMLGWYIPQAHVHSMIIMDIFLFIVTVPSLAEKGFQTPLDFLYSANVSMTMWMYT